MAFFHYSQNNSGGSFDFDEDTGVTHHVVIEAESAEHADARLEEIGGYFDGCDIGKDCPCCGDRWYQAHGEGDECPKIYGGPVGVKSQGTHFGKFMASGREASVVYLDGKIEWFNADNTAA